MAAMSVSIRSSSKLPWTGLSCSLRLASLCRLSNAISWASLFIDRFDAVDLLAHRADLR